MINSNEEREPTIRIDISIKNDNGHPEQLDIQVINEAKNENSSISFDSKSDKLLPQTRETEKKEDKEDKVALSRKKMNESKKMWTERTPIEFKMTDPKNKYIGCVSKRIGIKHINEGIPCQDNFEADYNPEKGYAVIAIADGHGDKRHDLSQYGSKIACERLCWMVDRILSEDKRTVEYFSSAEFRMSIVNEWKEDVLKFHRENKREFEKDNSEEVGEFDEVDIEKIISRYGTTLLFAFAYKGFYVVGQLGDGGIVILSEKNKRCRIHKAVPIKMSGSVESLCMKYAEAFIDIKIYPEEECSGVVLMTDGYYDLWATDESLFKASQFFLETLIECDEYNISLTYNNKYNEAVDYVADDISVGVLTTKMIRKSNGGDVRYNISDIRSSCMRTTYTLSGEDNIFKAIHLDSFRSRESLEISEMKEMNPFPSNIINPVNVLSINGLSCYLYQDSADDRLTLDDYCKNFIVYRRKMDELQTIRVLIGILSTLSKAGQLFETKKISLADFSDMVEFSVSDGSVVIYWTYPGEKEGKDDKNNRSDKDAFVGMIAKYMLNLMSVGKLFYGGNEKCNVSEKSWFYEKNLVKYPDWYRNLLNRAADAGNGITINELLDKTVLLQRHSVYCASCRKLSFCNVDGEKNGSCDCGKTFDIFAVLQKKADDNIVIPLSANTVIFVYNSEAKKYEGVIEVIEEMKGNEKRRGLKNITKNKAWEALTGENRIEDVKIVGPAKVKDFSNCISLKINDEEYKIVTI